MVNKKTKLCKYKDCIKAPSFGYETRDYCKKHAKKDMFNIAWVKRSC